MYRYASIHADPYLQLLISEDILFPPSPHQSSDASPHKQHQTHRIARSSQDHQSCIAFPIPLENLSRDGDTNYSSRNFQPPISIPRRTYVKDSTRPSALTAVLSYIRHEEVYTDQPMQSFRAILFLAFQSPRTTTTIQPGIIFTVFELACPR